MHWSSPNWVVTWKVVTICSWLNFGSPAPLGRDLQWGENFWRHLLQPARGVCVSLSTFSLYEWFVPSQRACGQNCCRKALDWTFQLECNVCVLCNFTIHNVYDMFVYKPTLPRAGSGVVRMDLLHFLAGCRTRRLNQGRLAVCHILTCFFIVLLLFIRAPFYVLLVFIVCVLGLLIVNRLTG